MIAYILKYPNGKYVGVDVSSGGCAYPVSSLSRANVWGIKNDALKYARKFPKENFLIFQINESSSGISIEKISYDWRIGDTEKLPLNLYQTTYIDQMHPNHHSAKIAVHGLGDDSIHLARIIVDLLNSNFVKGQKI